VVYHIGEVLGISTGETGDNHTPTTNEMLRNIAAPGATPNAAAVLKIIEQETGMSVHSGSMGDTALEKGGSSTAKNIQGDSGSGHETVIGDEVDSSGPFISFQIKVGLAPMWRMR
jgi:hypothetical protein